VVAATRFLLLPPADQLAVDTVSNSLIIISGAWFLLRLLARGAARVQELATSDAEDPGRVRGLKTQLAVLQRVVASAIYVVSAALFLLQFEVVRSIGVSMLASAGIAGLVIGLAAQRPVSSLLSGIQLSITQPIRIGCASACWSSCANIPSGSLGRGWSVELTTSEARRGWGGLVLIPRKVARKGRGS